MDWCVFGVLLIKSERVFFFVVGIGVFLFFIGGDKYFLEVFCVFLILVGSGLLVLVGEIIIVWCLRWICK